LDSGISGFHPETPENESVIKKGIIMGNTKDGFWGKVGIALGIAAFIVASFAIDGLLLVLSDIPIIGILAKWILHMRNNTY